ncbi:MAG: S8 family peptidase [Oscillospiraceae bacterium]|nr:S8 family peptidase [Oscillospiraceae bacterium]MCI8877402.1 S8 family peptidase [Oscillospiraceae bacterium]
MRLSPEMLTFIHAPDTVDFVTRATDAFFDYAHSSDEVVVGQLLSGRYVLGYVKAENFHRLEEALGAAFVSSASVVLGLLDRPALEASGVSQVHSQPYLSLKGRGVLLGFVDTGIDYTQDIFRYADGSSRIQYIYDQTAEGDPPPGFLLGREYSKAELDAALASEDPYSLVPARDESGHGTFLASVAAGKQTEDFSGVAPDAEIIAVKLKKARPFYREKYCVPADQEYAYESSAVMLGVEYILRKARELGRPVAICIGLGTNAGSHNGYSVFEEYLGGVSIQKGVCLCAAAGNEAEARHHTSGVLQPGEKPAQIDLKAGENAGDVYLAVWNTVADRISLSVRSPSGELVGRVPARPGASPAADVKLVLEAARVQIEYHFPVEGSGGQLSVIRILGITPGVWTIQLHGDIVLNGQYQVWLPMTGFVSPTVEFLAATPECTITSPASAVGLICCGAYDSAGKSLYAKSSRGPAWDGRMLPDLVAPGVGVRGIYPYGPGLMSGTSAAAAVLAGICALLLQWGVREGNDPSMGTYQVRAYLIRGCLRRDDMSYPNNQWGYGSVQLMRSFHLMREL